jgi:hypothetical protein
MYVCYIVMVTDWMSFIMQYIAYVSMFLFTFLKLIGDEFGPRF